MLNLKKITRDRIINKTLNEIDGKVILDNIDSKISKIRYLILLKS